MILPGRLRELRRVIRRALEWEVPGLEWLSFRQAYILASLLWLLLMLACCSGGATWAYRAVGGW